MSESIDERSLASQDSEWLHVCCVISLVDWESKSIPNPYMAITSAEVLQDNMGAAMEILRLPVGSRTT